LVFESLAHKVDKHLCFFFLYLLICILDLFVYIVYWLVVHKTNVYALVLNAKWTTINFSGSYVNEFRTFITLVQS